MRTKLIYVLDSIENICIKTNYRQKPQSQKTNWFNMYIKKHDQSKDLTEKNKTNISD